MATLTILSTDAGAPTLSGTNGTLCTVLDWALVQNGWAIEYTAANNRIYRAGSGLRHRLFVCHDSAVSGGAHFATMRGCESATAAGTGTITDPFPTVAQQANTTATVSVSNAAGATARSYLIKLSPTSVQMFIAASGLNTSGWDFMAFGDAAGLEAGDTWGAYCTYAGTASAGPSIRAMGSSFAAYVSGGATKLAWCRTIDGSVKSSLGHFVGTSGGSVSSPSNMSGAPGLRAGYGNRTMREKIAIADLASTTGTPGTLQMYRRGYLPSVHNLLHSTIGAYTSDDVFTDPVSAAAFRLTPASATCCLLVETSDTWTVPTG